MTFTIAQDDVLAIQYLDGDHRPETKFFTGVVHSLHVAKEFIRTASDEGNAALSVAYFVEVRVTNNEGPFGSEPSARFAQHEFPTIEAFLLTSVQWVENQRSLAATEVQHYLNGKFVPIED